MSRVERKKALENKKSNWGKKTFCIMLIFFMMVIGILKVDESFRSMMLLDGPGVMQYEKLDEDIHRVYFCGESVFIDEKRIRETMGYVKEEIEVFIEHLKNQKDQLVKKEG